MLYPEVLYHRITDLLINHRSKKEFYSFVKA